MNKAKQLIIALTLGFPKDHEVVDQAWDDDTAITDLMSRTEIRKEELLEKTSTGKTFFQYKKTWENIEKLHQVCPDFMGPDFLEKLDDGKSPADHAGKLSCSDAIFAPVFWKDKLDKFEVAWFEHASNTSDYERYKSRRRTIAELSGKKIREDQFKEMGITLTELQKAVNTGNYESVREKLKAHNDHLRATDILLMKSGKHMLYEESSWKNVDKLWEELNRHGETLPKEAFLISRRYSDSLVELAVKKYETPEKIFNEDVWHGRAKEMMELYHEAGDLASTIESRLNKFDIESVLIKVLDRELADTFDISSGVEKSDLTNVVKGPMRNRKDDKVSVTLLDLPSTWNNIEAIRKELEKSDESLNTDDLRTVSGVRGEPYMMTAARVGKFAQVLDISRQSGQPLTVQDLTTSYHNGETVFDVLVKNDQESLLLQPDLWAGREEDLCRFWEKFPKEQRSNVDFSEILSEVSLLTLRKAFNRNTPSANDNSSENNRRDQGGPDSLSM